MKDFRGIIFAYSACPELRELTGVRTAASLPFCGRYRLIDFALSSLRNADIYNVGIIMQRDYQSLLDHIGSGKAWDMSRRTGGIRMLPPFGLSEYHRGNYTGTIEALNAVSTYIDDIPEKYIVLMLGNLCANIDLTEAMAQHSRSDAEITAICSDGAAAGCRHRYVPGENGHVKQILLERGSSGLGYTSLEGYIVNKDTLLRMMNDCKYSNLYSFHRHAVTDFLSAGGVMDIYLHHGYAAAIRTVDIYFKASMDMLNSANRSELFPASRPVRTKNREEVSTYYGEHADAENCLIADNCIIDGELENCIVFSGVRIGQGSKLRNSIIFSKCVLEQDTTLDYVIADKYSVFSPGTKLIGTVKLPVLVPKGSTI